MDTDYTYPYSKGNTHTQDCPGHSARMARVSESIAHLINTRMQEDPARFPSVNAIADAMRMHQPTLQRYANGGIKKPAAEALLPIAQFFGVTIDDIVTGACITAGTSAPATPIATQRQATYRVDTIEQQQRLHDAVDTLLAAFDLSYDQYVKLRRQQRNASVPPPDVKPMAHIPDPLGADAEHEPGRKTRHESGD